MSTKNLLAQAQITINAPVSKVWAALIDPEKIKRYMFGTTVVTDWQKGSNIHWKGEMNGKVYEDKGVILELIPEQKLQYSHFSPLSGAADLPENYHTVTIELVDNTVTTDVILTQDKNSSEQSQAESEKNWNSMLANVKNLIETKS